MRRESHRLYLSVVGALSAWLVTVGSAHAGPVELFRNTRQNPMKSDQIVAAFIYGGGGLFVSGDGGKSFGLTCSGATNPALKFERDISQFVVAGNGEIYLGLFNGLWKGQPNGCGFGPVAELKEHIIGAVAVDPIDPMRIYVGTSDGYNPDGTPRINSMWMKDGSSEAFTQIGKQETTWYSSIDVVKVEEKRRFYATGVVSKLGMDAMGMPTSEVRYYVRVSDDEGKTWTDNEYDMKQFGPSSVNATFSIVAIDPKRPDYVLGNVSREGMPDSFVFSSMQGKPGTWKQISELAELGGVAFGPDGKLYFGDNDQSSRSFFVVDELGSEPKRLSETWKVGCLQWDASKKRMLACKDWQYGTVDLSTGQFSSMLDMRCAERYVECPDQQTVKKACEAQLLAAYCGVTHYPLAPVCEGFDQGVDAATYLTAQGFTCVNGMVVNTPDGSSAGGTSGGAGSAGTQASTAGVTAGATATAGAVSKPSATGGQPSTEAPPAPKKSSGCSMSFVSHDGPGWYGLLPIAAAVGLIRRRRRAKS